MSKRSKLGRRGKGAKPRVEVMDQRPPPSHAAAIHNNASGHPDFVTRVGKIWRSLDHGVDKAFVVTLLCGWLAWGIEKYSHWRDQRSELAQLKPLREEVVWSIGDTYSHLAYGAKYSWQDIEGRIADDSFSHNHFSHCRFWTDSSQKKIDALERLIGLSGVGLGSGLLAKSEAFLTKARILRQRLTYFSDFHDRKWGGFVFASDGPASDLAYLGNIVSELQREYPQILARGNAVAGNAPTPDEISEIWTNVDNRLGRLFLDPAAVSNAIGRNVCVFTTGDMVRLNAMSVSTNNVVHVYNTDISRAH